MEELKTKINNILAWDMPHAQIEHREEAIKHILELPEIKAIQVQAPVKPACERKLIISIENDTVLFDNLNDFNPLEFMGILHNAVSTADVLHKTKVMQMVEKASKSV